MRPKKQVRALNDKELKQVVKLFRKESTLSSYSEYWQDRSEEITEIYKHHMLGQPTYWGLFQDENLLGTTGVIPTKVHNPFSSEGTYYDTDLIIDPELRPQYLIKNLIECPFKYSEYKKNERSPLVYGIEHIPNSLNICLSFAKKYDVNFKFVSSSKLHEIFITENPKSLLGDQLTSASDNKVSTVQSQLLRDLDYNVKQDWMRLYTKNSRKFLSPNLDDDCINKLIELDSKARLFYLTQSEKLAGAILLCDTKKARRLIFGKKKTLVRLRLEKLRKKELNEGDEFKVINGSLFFFENDWAQSKLIGAILQYCFDQDYHMLAIRDISLSPLLKIPDLFTYERRVFIVYKDILQKRSELEELVKANQLEIRLDGLFL